MMSAMVCHVQCCSTCIIHWSALPSCSKWFHIELEERHIQVSLYLRELSAPAQCVQAVYMILLLGWFFLPVYLSSGCATMPEYMRRRLGGKRLQLYFALTALLGYVLKDLSVSSAHMYTEYIHLHRMQ